MLTQNRKTIRALVIVAVGLALLSFLAVGGETWAAPPMQGTAPPVGGPGGPVPPAGCTIVATGVVCNSPAGDFTVTFPPGSGPIGSGVGIDAAFAGLPIPVAGGVSAEAASYVALGHNFRLVVTGPNGAPIIGTLAQPVDIAIHFSADDLAAAGGDVANLFVMVFDPATGIWTPLPTTSVDAATGVIHASLTSLPLNAVIGLFHRVPAVGGGGVDTTWFASVWEWLTGWIQ